MFVPDDITISLIVLGVFRFFAALIFFETVLGSKEPEKLLLPAGWLLYAAGPVFALYHYIKSGDLNHPFFGFFITLGTFILVICLIQTFFSPAVRLVVLLSVSLSVILTAAYLISPRLSSFYSVFGQLLIMLITFLVILYKRKWIVVKGGISSYVWLVIFFVMSLLSTFVHLVFHETALSARFTLTFTTNLFLFMAFLHFDREHTINQLQENKQRISDSLKEKEILLQEIHHRVKNNMMIMNSLLNLQASGFKDPEITGQFLKAQNRIESMALVHEKLYESKTLSGIRFKGYITALSEKLKYSYEDEIDIHLEVSDFEITPDILIPCGLIMNEIITNTVKHTLTSGVRKQVWIHAFLTDKHCINLKISDNGPGYPENFDPENTSGLGFQLITSLVEQLNADLSISNDGGGVVHFTIPLQG